MHTVFLGIGTNLGDREDNLRKSLIMIEKNIGKILKSSSVYETAPWGFDAENDFLNEVLKVRTSQTPTELLTAIKMIESTMGREKDQDRYSSRIIDIDILIYDNLVLEEKGLKIPHHLMHERRFVLVPLCEIAPDLIHPVFNKSILSLLNDCRDRGKVIKL